MVRLRGLLQGREVTQNTLFLQAILLIYCWKIFQGQKRAENRKVLLHVRRRRWLDSEGRSVILDTPRLTAEGTSYSAEFAGFLKKWLDTYPVKAQCVGRFFRTDGRTLGRAYKERLSDFNGWSQKAHAGERMLLEGNIGERLSIDETMLHHDLFTFLSNKDGHGKSGTLVAAVKRTTIADVTRILEKMPPEERLKVKEVTLDFSDSMMGIVRAMLPNAEVVVDCFHIMQLAGKGLEEMRLKLKRKAKAAEKKRESEFKRLQDRRRKARKAYSKKHKPRKSRNGKRLGRPPKRANEKYAPNKLENGETRVDLLTHVRYPLLKSGDNWTDFQKEEMMILFGLEPRMKEAYGLVNSLRCIFKKKQGKDTARPELRSWYKDVGRSKIEELLSVRDTIMSKEDYVLNYFNNRSTNASAESLNSKMKGFRFQVRGVSDLPFFMYRLMKIFG